MHALAALWQNPRGRLVLIGAGLIAVFIAIRYAAARGIGATSPIAGLTDTTGTTDGTGPGPGPGPTNGGPPGTTDGGSTDGGAFTSPYLPYAPGGPGGVPGTYIPTGPGVNLTGADTTGTVLTPGTFSRTVNASAGDTRGGASSPFSWFGTGALGGIFGSNPTAQAAALGATGSNPTVQAGAVGGLIPAIAGAYERFVAGGGTQTTPGTFARVLNPYGPRGAAQIQAGGAGPSAGGYSSIAQNQRAHRGLSTGAGTPGYARAVAPPHPNVSFAGLYRTAGLDV